MKKKGLTQTILTVVLVCALAFTSVMPAFAAKTTVTNDARIYAEAFDGEAVGEQALYSGVGVTGDDNWSYFTNPESFLQPQFNAVKEGKVKVAFDFIPEYRDGGANKAVVSEELTFSFGKDEENKTDIVVKYGTSNAASPGAAGGYEGERGIFVNGVNKNGLPAMGETWFGLKEGYDNSNDPSRVAYKLYLDIDVDAEKADLRIDKAYWAQGAEGKLFPDESVPYTTIITEELDFFDEFGYFMIAGNQTGSSKAICIPMLDNITVDVLDATVSVSDFVTINSSVSEKKTIYTENFSGNTAHNPNTTLVSGNGVAADLWSPAIVPNYVVLYSIDAGTPSSYTATMPSVIDGGVVEISFDFIPGMWDRAVEIPTSNQGHRTTFEIGSTAGQTYSFWQGFDEGNAKQTMAADNRFNIGGQDYANANRTGNIFGWNYIKTHGTDYYIQNRIKMTIDLDNNKVHLNIKKNETKPNKGDYTLVVAPQDAAFAETVFDGDLNISLDDLAYFKVSSISPYGPTYDAVSNVVIDWTAPSSVNAEGDVFENDVLLYKEVAANANNDALPKTSATCDPATVFTQMRFESNPSGKSYGYMSFYEDSKVTADFTDKGLADCKLVLNATYGSEDGWATNAFDGNEENHFVIKLGSDPSNVANIVCARVLRPTKTPTTVVEGHFYTGYENETSYGTAIENVDIEHSKFYDIEAIIDLTKEENNCEVNIYNTSNGERAGLAGTAVITYPYASVGYLEVTNNPTAATYKWDKDSEMGVQRGKYGHVANLSRLCNISVEVAEGEFATAEVESATVTNELTGEVVAITEGENNVSKNINKIAVKYSAPMLMRSALNRITLVDEDGNDVPFLLSLNKDEYVLETEDVLGVGEYTLTLGNLYNIMDNTAEEAVFVLNTSGEDLEVTDFEFYDFGRAINSISSFKNAAAPTVKFSVANDTGNAFGAKLLYVYYNQDTCQQVDITDINIDASHTLVDYIESLRTKYTGSYDKIAVFLWSDFGGLIPLSRNVVCQ